MVDIDDLPRPTAFGSSLKRRLTLGVIFVNFFVAALAASSLRQSWQHFQERAQIGTRNLALVLEEEIGSDIEKIDSALLMVAEELERRGGGNPRDMDEFLRRRTSRLQEVLGMGIADARGRIIHSAGVLPGMAKQPDRAFVGAGLTIGTPLPVDSSRVWSVPMSRRALRPDGAVAGQVYAALSVDHLTKTFETLEIGPHGVADLLDAGMRIVARYPEDGKGGAIGSVTATPELRKFVEADQVAGTYYATIDGIGRTYSFRKVGDYPLYVTVGFASDDYMVEWRDTLIKLLAWQLAFLSFTVFASRKAYRGWKRQQLAAEQLALSAKVFEESGECIVITDNKERILSVNNTFSKVTGYSASEVLGKTPRVMKSGRQDSEFYGRMWRSIIETSYWCGEIWDRRKNGEIYPKWLSISAVKDAGNEVSHYIGIFSDITERKAAEAHIEFMAYHDALTRLPNRLLAMDHLELAIAYAGRAGTKSAVLFLDLDNFKTINDSFGHATGDELLKAVASRLRDCTRDTDTVSRQGGDEFLIVLADVPDADAITSVAEKILDRLEETFHIDGHEIATSLSIGVSVYPDDGGSVETLLKRADTAMYHAKEAGRNAYRFYTEQMNVHAIEHQRVRIGLRRALERGELVLHYQPQIDLTDGRIIGAEALIRWNNPEQGLLSPGAFIPTAEETGLIVPIGDWVLREACRQAAAWRSEGLPDIAMAVNVSATQFRRGELEQSVQKALEESGLPPRFLELELTESILIQDTDKMLDALRRLKALGLMLSIDDFGTGYSSLSYLKRFNVDKLKIDRSFVSDMIENAHDATIVRTIIQMARSLNLRTIAEGVENERLVSFLRQNECDEAQGYYFARPMPASEFVEYLVAASKTEIKPAHPADRA